MQLEMLLALICELATRDSTSADRVSFHAETILLDTWQTNLKLTGRFGNWLQTSRESATREC